MVDICKRENIKRNQVVLHSDNDSPMKGATMLATLQNLGVMPSFSRPSVSNDNPYSESLFRTLKYRPGYPEKKFSGLDDARAWIESFVSCYNNEHCHSGIKFVTPAMRHQNKDVEILTKRQAVYEKAKARNPKRWSGNTRIWMPITHVALNPNNETRIGKEKSDFRDDLKSSVKERKRMTKELGPDAGHSRRENQESDLIKQLDKHLGDD